MSSDNGPAGAPRPQRLFAKVQIAMRIVNQKLDEQTLIGTWLSDAEMAGFRRTIRANIRADNNANIEAWPRGIPHDYVPDARRAIIAAINQTWDDLFDTSKIDTKDDKEWDTIIEADLLLRKFYTD